MPSDCRAGAGDGADSSADDVKAGENLAKKFTPKRPGVWEWTPTRLAAGKLTVSVRDRQGNETRIERTFSVGRGQQ
jgi:hypothetical protein